MVVGANVAHSSPSPSAPSSARERERHADDVEAWLDGFETPGDVESSLPSADSGAPGQTLADGLTVPAPPSSCGAFDPPTAGSPTRSNTSHLADADSAGDESINVPGMLVGGAVGAALDVLFVLTVTAVVANTLSVWSDSSDGWGSSGGSFDDSGSSW